MQRQAARNHHSASHQPSTANCQSVGAIPPAFIYPAALPPAALPPAALPHAISLLRCHLPPSVKTWPTPMPNTVPIAPYIRPAVQVGQVAVNGCTHEHTVAKLTNDHRVVESE